MLKQILLLTTCLSWATNLYAKDDLIPSLIKDGVGQQTNFDYKNNQVKAPFNYHKLYGNRNLNKEVYGYDNDQEIMLEDIIHALHQENTVEKITSPAKDPITLEKKEKSEIKEIVDNKKLDAHKDKLVATIEKIIPQKKEPQAKKDPFFISSNYDLQKSVRCPITPIVAKKLENKPEVINRSNNLRRKTKFPDVASGDIIYVKGKIRDINCVPIANAVINLWQTNAYGYYQNGDKKEIINDQDFVGSGTAIADNMGNFEFITILPGVNEEQAPNLNLSVNHVNFKPIETQIFFPSNYLNKTDSRLEELNDFEKTLVTAAIIPINPKNYAEGYMIVFDVTLNGVNQYRRFSMN